MNGSFSTNGTGTIGYPQTKKNYLKLIHTSIIKITHNVAKAKYNTKPYKPLGENLCDLMLAR
jgi:hypothetical protein